MNERIRLVSGTHVPAGFVRGLAKTESNALGFLSDEALDWYAHNAMLVGGLVNGDPTCFALGKLGSPTYPDAACLFMAAVRHDARRHKHAAWLVDLLRRTARERGLKRIQLWCRGDLASNELWAWCGMTPIAIREGGTGRKVPHVCWVDSLDGCPVTADVLDGRRRGRAGVPHAIAATCSTADVLDVIRTDPARLTALTRGPITADRHDLAQPLLFDLARLTRPTTAAASAFGR